MTDLRQVRHSVLAYALLFGFAWLVWGLGPSTIWSRLSEHAAATDALQQAVVQRQQQFRSHVKSVERLQDALALALEQGQVSSVVGPNLVSHQLQIAVKALFGRHGAVISSLNPSSESFDESLSRARLEINFNVSGAGVGDLLLSLESLKPAVYVELVSLRRLNYAQSERGEFQLDATLVLSVLHFNQAFRDALVERGLDAGLFEVGTPNAENAASAPPAASSKINLAGLFDADVRRRMQNPSADHYRLSAISVSSSARVAVIEDTSTGISYRVNEGDVLYAWKVDAIEGTSVSLVSGAQRIELQLELEN